MTGHRARRLTAALFATSGYLATIPTANWLTTRYPAAPVAPGVLAPALKEPVVGIGSVCRIQATEEAAEIVETIAEIIGPGRCHGFGFKITGLRKVACRLGSADSHAWSAQGRRISAHDCTFRLPRSRGPHKNEANCLRYALAWRQRALTAIEAGVRTPPFLSHDTGDAA
ncbi:hypothetical protein [Streptomyces sp. NPDC005784]|uniref:deazapurine DNA modification protein DpdA family protein n=1 Tax=Streptomyces sp. NPDC005784 TaxID=3364731 RepID=UPI0036A6430A